MPNIRYLKITHSIQILFLSFGFFSAKFLIAGILWCVANIFCIRNNIFRINLPIHYNRRSFFNFFIMENALTCCLCLLAVIFVFFFSKWLYYLFICIGIILGLLAIILCNPRKF